jgi:hypothetical protein
VRPSRPGPSPRVSREAFQMANGPAQRKQNSNCFTFAPLWRALCPAATGHLNSSAGEGERKGEPFFPGLRMYGKIKTAHPSADGLRPKGSESGGPFFCLRPLRTLSVSRRMKCSPSSTDYFTLSTALGYPSADGRPYRGCEKPLRAWKTLSTDFWLRIPAHGCCFSTLDFRLLDLAKLKERQLECV